MCTSVITAKSRSKRTFTIRFPILKNKYIFGVGEVFLYWARISIIKSLLLPKLIYIFSILPPPSEFVALIQTIIYKFLWKGPDKITRKAAINSFDNGGLNLTDLETSIKSLRLAWISKILNSESLPWKSYLRYLLKPFGGFFFFHCNYNIDDYNIKSIFYSEMLQWWSEFRSKYATETTSFAR